jgi:hypothetical protein
MSAQQRRSHKSGKPNDNENHAQNFTNGFCHDLFVS